MNRQPPYSDAIANTNTYVVPNMQMKQLSPQGMQGNSAINYTERLPDSFPVVPENIPYTSSHWNRDALEVRSPSQPPAHLYPDATRPGPGSNLGPHHQRQATGFEEQANGETGEECHEQDMEVGYEDGPLHLTFEGLEKIFKDETLKLIEERIHAEDGENSRHREKTMEIQNKYQEKLLALRAQQAILREKFIKKEAGERLRSYQQSGIGNPMIRTSPTNLRGHAGPLSAEEAHRAYSYGQNGHFDSYRDQSPLLGRQERVGRVPYPQGRVYNNTGARF